MHFSLIVLAISTEQLIKYIPNLNITYQKVPWLNQVLFSRSAKLFLLLFHPKQISVFLKTQIKKKLAFGKISKLTFKIDAKFCLREREKKSYLES